MAELYYPFDGADGDIRQYPSSFLAGLVLGITPNGVIAIDNELEVSAASGLSVDVASGMAFVQGRHYRNTSVRNIELETADPNDDRIDRIVLRMDNSATVRSISVVAKTGTPSGSPSAPGLTQTGTVWEIPLATVSVPQGATTPGTITDQRELLSRGEPVTVGQEFSIPFVLDGGGQDIEPGIKGWVRLAFNANINQSSIVANASGNLAITVRQATHANFPSMSSMFSTSLSSQQKREDSRDINVDAGNWIEVEVTGTPTVELATLSLRGTKI